MPFALETCPEHAVTGAQHPPIPAAAQRLRLPLHQRSQQRMRERWGFDLNQSDAGARGEAVLAGAPHDVDALLLAAAVRSSRGDDAGALVAAEQAVAADPQSARAHSSLAALLSRGGDAVGARQHALTATELDPLDPVARYNLGLARWSLGDHRSAREDFDRAATMLGLARRPWWRRSRG